MFDFCNSSRQSFPKYSPKGGGGQSSIILYTCMTKKTGIRFVFGDWKGNPDIVSRPRVSKTAIFKKYGTFSRILSDFEVKFGAKITCQILREKHAKINCLDVILA